MLNRTFNNVKLGLFLLGGLLFLVLMLYMIGKNQHLFGKTYLLRARFGNVNGLVSGNNVRVSGIQAGSVKRISFLSDTVIEVTMLIDRKMKTIVRRNAVVSIGTDGLVGNKVVNIVPGRGYASLAEEGDLLMSKKGIDTEDMLQTLNRTNNDAALVAAELKTTIQRLNQSKGLWQLINDESIPANLKQSTVNIRHATAKANEMTRHLDEIVLAVKEGKGSIGALLTDSGFAVNLNATISSINEVADQAHSLTKDIDTIVRKIDRQMNNRNGTLYTLLNDSSLSAHIKQSADNIEKATDGFNQNMEALKHNFLFRGYFRKQEKQQNKSKIKAKD